MNRSWKLRLAAMGMVLALGAGEWAAAPAVAGAAPVEIEQQELDGLLADLRALQDEVDALRKESARLRLERDEALRRADELETFIDDVDTYGDAWDQYAAYRDAREREARQAAMAEAREAQAERDEERRAAAAARRAAQRERDAERQQARDLRRAGFESIGGDIYMARMGFAYHIRTELEEIDGFRRYPFYTVFDRGWYRPYGRRYFDVDAQLDYSRMTISGSVLNATDEARAITVGIRFFDDGGAQIGGTTVTLDRVPARTPIPFTQELSMAANVPFSASQVYVVSSERLAAPTDAGGAAER